MGRSRERPRRKIKNISTVHAPMPGRRRDARRVLRPKFLGLFEGGDDAVVVFCARSFIARTFAPDKPALRRTGLRSFSICSGEGARPLPLNALIRPKMVARLCRYGLVGDGFKESFVGRLQGIWSIWKGVFLRSAALGTHRVRRCLVAAARSKGRAAGCLGHGAPFRKRGNR